MCFLVRVKSTIRRISNTPEFEEKSHYFLSSPSAHLIPSTERPGVHLHVNILALTGLGAAVTTSGKSGPPHLHIRIHCLLLLPQTNQPRLLATAVSKTPINEFYVNQEQLQMQLDVLLPLGWRYASSSNEVSSL